MLTVSDSKVLDAIKLYYDTHGFSPSFRDIAHLCGYKSTNTVAQHLNKLQRLGYIQTQNMQPRTIKILL